MAILSPLWRLHYQSPCNGSWWCNSSRMHFSGWAFCKTNPIPKWADDSPRLHLYVECIYIFYWIYFPNDFSSLLLFSFGNPRFCRQNRPNAIAYGALLQSFSPWILGHGQEGIGQVVFILFFFIFRNGGELICRLRTKRHISMQVVGSCFCLSSRMLGGAFAQQLDKAVIQDVIHAGIFRYI